MLNFVVSSAVGAVMRVRNCVVRINYQILFNYLYVLLRFWLIICPKLAAVAILNFERHGGPQQ